MLQPARCRRLIRTQPISYLPAGDDTRPPWQFYDGIASCARGLAPWNPKSRTNVFRCGRQATSPSAAGEMTCASNAMPDELHQEHAQIHAAHVLDRKPRVSARRGTALP